MHSGGIGPCIVVGALYGCRGYMAHDDGAQEGCLERLFNDIRLECPDKSMVRVFVAGGGFDSYMSPGLRKYILANRNFTLDLIAREGLKIERLEWNKSNSTQQLSLILAEQKAVFEIEMDE